MQHGVSLKPHIDLANGLRLSHITKCCAPLERVSSRPVCSIVIRSCSFSPVLTTLLPGTVKSERKCGKVLPTLGAPGRNGIWAHSPKTRLYNILTPHICPGPRVARTYCCVCYTQQSLGSVPKCSISPIALAAPRPKQLPPFPFSFLGSLPKMPQEEFAGMGLLVYAGHKSGCGRPAQISRAPISPLVHSPCGFCALWTPAGQPQPPLVSLKYDGMRRLFGVGCRNYFASLQLA